MTNRYIIKNCPAFLFETLDDEEQWAVKNACCYSECSCNEIYNCLLKQIVEKCEKAIKTYENEEFYEDDCDRFLGECSMARDILDLLDISEVEE